MIYCVTVKKTRLPISMQHYVDYLAWLAQKGKITSLNFEDTRGLHCHFLFDSKNGMNLNDWYMSKYGWNIKATPCYCISTWNKYCIKDADKPLNKQFLLAFNQGIVNDECHCGDESDDDYREDIVPITKKLFSTVYS